MAILKTSSNLLVGFEQRSAEGKGKVGVGGVCGGQ